MLKREKGEGKMKLLAVIPAFFAVNAWAACPYEIPQKPVGVPNGAEATLDEMVAAQVSAQTYVEEIDIFVSCRKRALGKMRHNYMVGEAERVAELYNVELRRFKQQAPMVAEH
jgi:hypothetical protein